MRVSHDPGGFGHVGQYTTYFLGDPFADTPLPIRFDRGQNAFGRRKADVGGNQRVLDRFETVELDWRSTNLLASRFWPRRGFRPTHLRLRRDVQPTA